MSPFTPPARPAFFAVCMLLPVACTRTREAPKVRADTPVAVAVADAAPPTAPSVAPAAAVRQDAAPASVPTLLDAKAWTDDVAISALAKDCRAEVKPEHDYESHPLSCQLEFEQSCIPDVCFDEDQRDCKPKCKKGCDDCSGACATKCEACKAPCADEACREACATKCGECRQACLTAKDECTSGTCGKAFRVCRARVTAEWNKGGCTKACKRVEPCAQKCFEEGGENCQDKCKKLMGTCPTKFFANCVMGGDPSLE